MAKQTHPTYVNIVFDLLVAKDDFLTKEAIQQETRLDRQLVLRSLSHLRKHKAIEAISVDGVLWWFATPHTDDRAWRRAQIAHFTKTKKSTRVRARKPESLLIKDPFK